MRLNRLCVPALAGAIGTALTVLVGSASAGITVVGVAGGDTGFSALTNNGTLERAVAEGRIGNNNASNGTWEQGIWEFGGVGSLKAQGGTTWTSGTAIPFSVSYDGLSTITFTQGSDSLSWNQMAGPFTDIFIRTRSARADTTISLTSMSLSGFGALGTDLITSGSGTVDYLRIVNTSNFGAFTLSGMVNPAWSGTAPSNSALAYQVKLSNVIPSPSVAGGLGLGALMTMRRRRVG